MKQTIKSKALVAGAITGGLAGASHAATVQITLTGNMISSSGGSHLMTDITGDGKDDVTFGSSGFASNSASVAINGNYVNGSSTGGARNADASFASSGVGIGFYAALDDINIKYLNPVTFTDDRINQGQPTEGYLEVNSIAGLSNGFSVILARFVFDDESMSRPSAFTDEKYPEFGAVPEPSSLTLLALGAGGLLARRNRKKAA